MRAMTSSDSQRGSVDRSGTDRARGDARRLSVRTRETPRKRALLTVLGAADGFLSVPELHSRLRAELESQGLRIGIATVYSQLRCLVEAGAPSTSSWATTVRADTGFLVAKHIITTSSAVHAIALSRSSPLR